MDDIVEGIWRVMQKAPERSVGGMGTDAAWRYAGYVCRYYGVGTGFRVSAGDGFEDWAEEVF